jgi:SAM-dependent methyltransferase
VLELGCGTGTLLAAAAQRVGPTGWVVGVDRKQRLLAAAREHTAPFPWVELVESDAMAYEAGGTLFDGVHCRLVLMHPADPAVFVAHMVALARPGGKVAAQEHDVEGANGTPVLACFPPFPAFHRLTAAFLATVTRLGSDPQAGRKLPSRFQQAGLTNLQIHGVMPCFGLTAPRASALLDLLGGMIGGTQAEAMGVTAAADYEALVEEVRAAHRDPAYAAHLVRSVLMVATVGTKPLSQTEAELAG